MSIERDDGAERDDRVTRMVTEFREARARRTARQDHREPVLTPDPDGQEAQAASAAAVAPRGR